MEHPPFIANTCGVSTPAMPSLNWRTLSGAAYLESPSGNTRFHVAGIVNVTPDSFHDGGLYTSVQAATNRALAVVQQGAGIVDFGAESTRPGATEVTAGQEFSRLSPVLQNFCQQARIHGIDPCISVDTYRAATARKLLEAGFTGVINDISGGSLDPEMAAVICEFKPGYVLGHCPMSPKKMQHNPQYGNVTEDLLAYFEARMHALVGNGLPEENIALDPCIGFGKSVEHNLALLRDAWRFHSLGRPLYYGISHKSFLAGFLPSGGDRTTLTQVATALLAEKGVQIHRVHDVAETVATLDLAGQVASCLCVSHKG